MHCDSPQASARGLPPDKAARLFGLGSDNQQPFTTQLFGSRELTLAIAITDTASPQLRTRALQLGLLADTLDIIAALRGIRRHTLSPAGAILTGGARRCSPAWVLPRWPLKDAQLPQ